MKLNLSKGTSQGFQAASQVTVEHRGSRQPRWACLEPPVQSGWTETFPWKGNYKWSHYTRTYLGDLALEDERSVIRH